MTSNDQQIDLVINRLKRAQYEELYQQGKIDETQLYIITDDPTTSQVVSSYLSDYYPKSETSSAVEIQEAFDNIPRPDVSDLRNKADLSVYTASGNSWDLPDGIIMISEATKTGGKYIFIAVGNFGNAYSNEEYDTAEQRAQATSATFTINGNEVVVQRIVNYVPTGDTIATNSTLNDLSNQVNPSESNVSASGDYFRIYADKMNNLVSVSDHMKIVLDNYNFSKSYVMKFNTPENSEIHFDFYIDNGSDPQFDPEMNINKSYSFPMNSGYVVEVKFDAMDIRPLAWTGDRQKMTFRTIEWVEDE